MTHEIFPDKPAFNPEPGRIVLLRYPSGRVLPGIIVQVKNRDNVLVSAQTGDRNIPVDPDWWPERKAEDEWGWFRPGDWPQPTMGG